MSAAVQNWWDSKTPASRVEIARDLGISVSGEDWSVSWDELAFEQQFRLKVEVERLFDKDNDESK